MSLVLDYGKTRKEIVNVTKGHQESWSPCAVSGNQLGDLGVLCMAAGAHRGPCAACTPVDAHRGPWVHNGVCVVPAGLWVHTGACGCTPEPVGVHRGLCPACRSVGVHQGLCAACAPVGAHRGLYVACRPVGAEPDRKEE